MRSKALKFFNDIKDDGLRYWIKSITYYPVQNFFNRTYERVCRTLAFARIAWLHYDFDSAYLWHIMAFKLKRIEKALINGHAIQEEADMAALKEAIEICERLFGEDYEFKYHGAHDLRWGNIPDYETVPSEYDKDGKILTYRIVFKDRPNVKSDADRELERKEFLRVYELGEADRVRDMDRLAVILKDHSRSWWD